MENKESEIVVKKNGVKAWMLASRPKTLTGAAAPVLIGAALAWQYYVGEKAPFEVACVWSVDGFRSFLLPVILCFLFAFVMQIDANFVNDYYDYKKGTDRSDRLGPPRACAQGWVSAKAMSWAIAVTTVIACAIGLSLVLYGGWRLVGVGLLCVLFCFLYTTKLSYLGYGDLLVLVFFGFVPVCFTYYVVAGEWSLPVLLSGLSCGVATDCLLMVNNYRDREQDRISGKRTLVVKYGDSFGLQSYILLGIVAFLLSSLVLWLQHNVYGMVMLLYLVLHVQTFRKMCKRDGKALNSILGKTARNIFVFGFLFALAVVLQCQVAV